MIRPPAMLTLLIVLYFITAVEPSSAAPKEASPKGKDETPYDTSRGDRMIADYFRAETHRLTDACLSKISSAIDWEKHRDEYRRQLREMLSLDPLPERTPLEPMVTGTFEQPGFVVEKVEFQSMPGLYVTGNLYRPTEVKGKLPTILYVCGHGQEKKDGISFGNKTHYRHHGAWFARNGYVCLMIDTLQLGEIEGLHHGTYREGMWWWNSRGYTPAGVEAWNSIRALDYLETRPEVDADRFGVTGRSGGGAYSWWVAALDDRIKVAVPVAGITSLKNHVVDGCVEGHCDCMYPVNTYQWDYPQVAALVSPRPLLITNTDKDRIFPLDGVVDVYNKTRRIYELQGALDKIGLQISDGPHVDSQELQIAAFHWFNRHLKGEDPPIEMAALPFATPADLRVFGQLPTDERNTKIQESFVPSHEEFTPPKSVNEWTAQRDGWLKNLREKCFRGWPTDPVDGGAQLDVEQAFSVPCGLLKVDAYDFTSQEKIRLRLFLVRRADLELAKAERVVLHVLDDAGWREFLGTFSASLPAQLKDEERVLPDEQAMTRMRKNLESSAEIHAYVAPRGIGPTEWTRDPKKRTHIRRRFMLLGQTLDGMRVWDMRRAIQSLRSLPGLQETALIIDAHSESSVATLYAALFETGIARLNLHQLPTTHQSGPDFLNVMRFLDIPQAVGMAAEHTPVHLFQAQSSGWDYPIAVGKNLGWTDGRITVQHEDARRSPESAGGAER